jgi:hypothetical protein
VEELGNVAQRAATQASLRKYLGQLKQECRLKLQEERNTFKICSAADLTALDLLCREASSATDAAAQASRLTTSQFSTRYETDALALGRAAIIKAFAVCPPAKPAKHIANRWLNLWATIALNRSYELGLDFPARDEGPLSLSLETLLDKIIQGINRPLVRYQCYLSIRSDNRPRDPVPGPDKAPESVNRLKTVLNSSSIKLSSHQVVQGLNFTPEPHDLIVTKEMDALSPRAALEAFVLELQPIFNILGFYQSHPPAEPIKNGWAGISSKDLSYYDIDPFDSSRIHPRKEAVQLSSDAVAVYKSGRLTGPIANALELYHMAISSPDWRVKFTTMWSALESLSSTTEGKSVIARVTNMIVPIVTWRRMDKEIRYLGMTLRQHRETNKTYHLARKALPSATGREVPAEDVLMTVTKPSNHPHILELLASAGNHSLLSWRIYSVWKTYHNPAHLAEDFRASKERLTWHIARIYRARNQLAHHGQEPEQARLLLDNLHFYLSTAISRFLTALKDNTSYDMKESVAYWQKHSDRVYADLGTSADAITVTEILSKCRIRAKSCPWSPAEHKS